MAEYIVLHGIRVAKDFVSATFGRLTTIGPKFRIGNDTRQMCQCSCGDIEVYYTHSKLYRSHKMCSKCFRAKPVKRYRFAKSAANADGTGELPSEYKIWTGMRTRCGNPNTVYYPRYGGRGIKICDRWLEANGQGFLNFLADMGPRPSDKHSIDRIDVNGDYCPENCRWATAKEQMRNRSNNVLITAWGKTELLQDVARKYGISPETVKYRIKKGMTPEEALTLPLYTRSQNP